MSDADAGDTMPVLEQKTISRFCGRVTWDLKRFINDD